MFLCRSFAFLHREHSGVGWSATGEFLAGRRQFRFEKAQLCLKLLDFASQGDNFALPLSGSIGT
jgi:hypothetical protein